MAASERASQGYPLVFFQLYIQKRRLILFNVALAVADYRSLDTKKDVVPTDLIYTPEQIGETLTVLYNPSQKWYYLSDMQPSEALLLKCFDSLSTTENPKEGIASLAPHTAFQDARYVGKSGIEPRESIEIRALVYSSA